MDLRRSKCWFLSFADFGISQWPFVSVTGVFLILCTRSFLPRGKKKSKDVENFKANKKLSFNSRASERERERASEKKANELEAERIFVQHDTYKYPMHRIIGWVTLNKRCSRAQDTKQRMQWENKWQSSHAFHNSQIGLFGCTLKSPHDMQMAIQILLSALPLLLLYFKCFALSFCFLCIFCVFTRNQHKMSHTHSHRMRPHKNEKKDNSNKWNRNKTTK